MNLVIVFQTPIRYPRKADGMDTPERREFSFSKVVALVESPVNASDDDACNQLQEKTQSSQSVSRKLPSIKNSWSQPPTSFRTRLRARHGKRRKKAASSCTRAKEFWNVLGIGYPAAN